MCLANMVHHPGLFIILYLFLYLTVNTIDLILSYCYILLYFYNHLLLKVFVWLRYIYRFSSCHIVQNDFPERKDGVCVVITYPRPYLLLILSLLGT